MRQCLLSLAVFVLPALAAKTWAAEPQLAHMVYFTLADDTPGHREKLIAACQKHLTGHEGTVYFSAGAIADELKREVNDREFDVALHLVFANRAAHDKYQTHPRHLQFIKENKELWSNVRVFDSYIAAQDAPAVGGPLKDIGDVLETDISIDVKQASLHDVFTMIDRKMRTEYEIEFPVDFTMMGKHLQVSGITRNQLVRELKFRDQPLADVLTELVVKANPDRGAKSPADPRQVLVWVVGPDKKSILVTTRRAAKTNGYELPSIFRVKKEGT